MNTLFTLLTVQAVMGAFDNLWHHELQAQLPQRPSARHELALHAAREAIYGVVFIGLAWWQWQGAFAVLMRLELITPQGDLLTLFEDGDREASARFDAEFDSGKIVSADTMAATGGKIVPWLTSITFGGADLTTAYLGTLKATALPCFKSPVAGLPMVHW